MKINRITLLFLSIIMILGLVGCGGSALPKATPVPTKVPVTLGHYSGTNPEVSFDITANGVENFTLTIPFGGTDTCTLGPLDTTAVKSDGTFAFSLMIMKDSTTPDLSINGTIAGTAISGKYADQVCGSGSHIEKVTPGYSGNWSASLGK
jgi:hypothetical protein